MTVDYNDNFRKLGEALYPIDSEDMPKFMFRYCDPDWEIQAALGVLAYNIQKAREQLGEANKRLALKEEEILKEYKEEQEEKFAGSIYTMNTKEVESRKSFILEHSQCKPIKYIYHITDHMFGTNITIQCPVCKKMEDITDTTKW